MLEFVFFFHKESADLSLRVPAFNAVFVQHIKQAIYRHWDFIQVRKDELFWISRPHIVRLHKQEENAFHGSSLGVDFDVN